MAKGRQLETKDLDRNFNQAIEASRGRATEQRGSQESQGPAMSSWSHPLSSGVVSVSPRPGRASLKHSDEIKLLPMLAGEHGHLFVVFHHLSLVRNLHCLIE